LAGIFDQLLIGFSPLSEKEGRDEMVLERIAHAGVMPNLRKPS
jgi:hypothetical protein